MAFCESSRGLRQSNPLSSLPFVIVMEALRGCWIKQREVVLCPIYCG